MHYIKQETEDAHENAQWRKAKPMQKDLLYLLWSKYFEDTFKKTQCGQVKQMQQM